MTIEERALQVCNLKEVPDEEERYYNHLNCEKYDALVKFGKEQQEIDIKEFAAKLENACLTVESKYNMNTFGFLYGRIIEAMKGE